MKKFLTMILTVIMFASLLVGCAPSTPAKDTLTFMSAINAESLDPASGVPGDHTYYHAVFDTLVNYDDNAQIRPGLAESWTKGTDGVTYTFNLRQDVKFHDGSDFTADDVIYTMDTIMALPLYGQFTLTFASWQKVDDYTVTITATFPYTKLLETLAVVPAIVPRQTHSADPAGFANMPIGTGPYKFVSRDTDGTINLVANEDYWGGAPAFANAILKPPVESSTAVVALENGEVDAIITVPPSQIPLIQQNNDLELVETSGYLTYTLMMMGDPLRQDMNLRQAIFHGIDRAKLVEIANEGIGQPSTDLFNAKLLGDLAGSVEFVGYDKELAQELLSQSTYQPGQTILMTITPDVAAMAQSIQADLSDLGITIEIEQLDVNGWSTKIINGEAAMTLVPSGSPTSSLESTLGIFSQSYPYFGKDMYSTPEYENLITQINAEANDAARKVLLEQALVLQYEYANSVPLFDAVSNFAHNKAVTNISPISAVTEIFYIGDFKPAE